MFPPRIGWFSGFAHWNCQVHLKPRSQQHLPLSLQQGKVNVPRRTSLGVKGSQGDWWMKRF